MNCLKKWITRILMGIGFLLLLYPAAGNMIRRQQQKDAVDTCQTVVDSRSSEEISAELERAEEYNSMLFQSAGAVVNHMDTGILSEESYQSILNQTGGIMGSIQIPRISVDLPVYHGTSEEVLSNGVGHQQGTSLPTGGESTHCVLTGHRGLPGSSLFTRLDELREGDLFYLNVLGMTLAYRVYGTEVVEPDDTDVLKIQEGKDECSLVTCTPYGLNTHRLVIHGERVPYEAAEFEEITQTLPSGRECFFTVLPLLLGTGLIIVKIWEWRKKRNVRNKKTGKSGVYAAAARCNGRARHACRSSEGNRNMQRNHSRSAYRRRRRNIKRGSGDLLRKSC